MANNNAILTTLTAATNMMLGATAIENMSLQNIVDTGASWDFEQKDQWAKALTGLIIKDIYPMTTYENRSNDVFYEDAAMFGAAMRVIDIEMPDVIENRAWEVFTSGTSTIGSNKVYLPIVNQKLYGNSVSWAIPLAFTGTQLNEAFRSETDLLSFYNYLRLVAENSIRYHQHIMQSMNRNNYLAEKIAIPNSKGKINTVNLVEEYAKHTGATTLTAADFLKDANALRYSIKTLKKYRDLMLEMSTLFTTDANSKGKFVAYDRLVFQVLSDFEGLINSEVRSNTYHDEFVEMPLHRTVVAWQGLTGDSASADFETLSSIEVTTANGATASKSGIVGLMCDKWAIMHTIVNHRVGVQRDDIKDVTLNDYQFTDRYINNLSLNGVVFTVEDYEAA